MNAQFFYGIFQEYGKNRVQYNDFTWSLYRMDRYDIYYYSSDRNLPRKAALFTERHIKDIERKLEAQIEGRIQILLFNSMTDLKQSNVNKPINQDLNTGGKAEIPNLKVFLHFNGDYTHLENQIKYGLTEAIINNLVFGDFTQSLRNSATFFLPDWFIKGLCSYYSMPWDVELDQKVRDGFVSGDYNRFNNLSGDDARIAGHSFWEYIAQTYSEAAIKNVLFLTILNRNIDIGFEEALGKKTNGLTLGWQDYFKSIYQATAKEGSKQRPLIKMRKDEYLGQMALNTDENKLAYAVNRLGEYRIYLYDIDKKKRKKLLRKGFKIAQNTDYSFPLLAWHPSEPILSYIIEEKGFIWLYLYNLEKKKTDKRKLFGVEKIISYSYSPDGNTFLMTAIREGRSDVFEYTIRSTSFKKLTNDDYIDAQATYINKGRDVLFVSDRTSDSLNLDQDVDYFQRPYSLFILNPNKGENQKIKSVGLENQINFLQPQSLAPGYFAYLGVQDRVQNLFLVKMDSAIAYVDTTTHYRYFFHQYKITDYHRNIHRMAVGKTTEKLYGGMYVKGRFQIQSFDLPDLQELDIKSTPKPTQNKPTNNAAKPLDVVLINSDKEIDLEIDIDDYDFDEKVLEKLNLKPKNKIPPVIKGNQSISTLPQILNPKVNSATSDKKTFELPPKRNYLLTFYQEKFGLQLSNVFINPQYQPFTGRPNGGLVNPGINGNVMVGISDVMRDYTLIAGFRTNFIPLAGRSLVPDHEVFFNFINHKKRWKKESMIFRRSQIALLTNMDWFRYLSHEASQKFIYPLNEVQSFHFQASYRLDNQISLAREQNSLQNPTTYTHYGIGRVYFVHDNTIAKGINLYEGTRYKIFTEYYRNLLQSPSGMHTLGIDYRNYQRVWRSVIWANRFAAGTSFGTERLIHYLGGVDNEFVPRFDESTPWDRNQNYAFQTVITNMRGFWQNARNGNSFMVLNSELRIPVFRALFNRPLRSDFLTNFQIIAFGDLGTAWNGITPYSEENVINKQVIERGNITVTIDSQKEPIIGGIGAGIRTRLFGYFVRFDWSWGIEDGVLLPNLFNVSLSTDF